MNIKSLTKSCLLSVSLFCFSTGFAGTVVQMHKVAKQGVGASVGTITLSQSRHGLLIKPNLHGLPPGDHGFHVHQYPNCSDNGMAAGGHLDPKHTGKHLGPYNSHGHLGDLPALIVNKKGMANLPLLAPRLKLSDIEKHSLMIHANGDNYSDSPKKLGGGGARIACGVIPT